jgi:hypothetical protein
MMKYLKYRTAVLSVVLIMIFAPLSSLEIISTPIPSHLPFPALCRHAHLKNFVLSTM